MRQEDAIRVMYNITDIDIVNRIYELQRYIKIKLKKDWSILYLLDVFFERLYEKDMQELIKEYLKHESVYEFEKALKIVFDLKNNEEIIEILGDYCNAKTYKK